MIKYQYTWKDWFRIYFNYEFSKNTIIIPFIIGTIYIVNNAKQINNAMLWSGIELLFWPRRWFWSAWDLEEGGYCYHFNWIWKWKEV